MSYQSEAALEQQFMEQLNKQGLPWHEVFNEDLEV